MRNYQISEKKRKLMEEFQSTDFCIDDEIHIQNKYINEHSRSPEISTLCTIKKIEKDHLYIKVPDYYELLKISKDIAKNNKYDFFVGANPISTKRDVIESVGFNLESVLYNLNILGERDHKPYLIQNDVEVKELNWNPFIYDHSNAKRFYQRAFVWSVQAKQDLIDSLYNGIECGRILVRLRSFEELEQLYKKGERELAFHDIVDGKQRLNALQGFLMGEFPDSSGNFISDLSNYAQLKLVNNKLISYVTMPENSKDEDVLEQFLKLNFCGVPQSKEHIEYVKSLLRPETVKN